MERRAYPAHSAGRNELPLVRTWPFQDPLPALSHAKRGRGSKKSERPPSATLRHVSLSLSAPVTVTVCAIVPAFRVHVGVCAGRVKLAPALRCWLYSVEHGVTMNRARRYKTPEREFLCWVWGVGTARVPGAFGRSE